MQTLRNFIIAAPNCANTRSASYFERRNGILYVAQSPRALAQLLGEYQRPAPQSGIPAGIMRRVDQFRAFARRIQRERNCNSEIARAIARHYLRAN